MVYCSLEYDLLYINRQITGFYQELQSGVVDLLIHTPNSFADVGSNTDRSIFYSLVLVTNQIAELS